MNKELIEIHHSNKIQGFGLPEPFRKIQKENLIRGKKSNDSCE